MPALFQFQNGAVKAHRVDYLDCRYICFNSKMVRLRPCLGLDLTLCQHCFNSKMVRLRPNSSVLTSSPSFEFQFQNGAVKALRLRVKCKPIALFQFQNGAVKALFRGSVVYLRFLFQFQNGAVKA